MSNTNQHPALTCVMSEHQLVSVVRRYLPSQKPGRRSGYDRLRGCGNGRGYASL
ncbi:hypothetical protein GLUCOINTEAF2_0203242 [Komagataeibacter intermedius AF2]|uniref:Uncharacterized protein n=1 Tax=Komagataeibacter intermedius AF2 TaxID=1458464 RepID=A0A0N1F9T1_9PROT|nr:hypothetical protein GLUCOINTEAF2_0203242 [Komagataeibacter intermedius AF2]